MVVIITLHRSGSTYLLNLLSMVKGLYPLEDELNLYERFRGNTLDKILKTKDPYKRIRAGKVYGSWFKYHSKYSEFFLSLEKCGTLEFIVKLDEYINRKYSREMLVKYLVHFRKAKLINDIPNSKLIFLLRNPKDQILSKLNDDSSRVRRTRWYGTLYEVILILYFFIENYLFRKKIEKISKGDDDKNFIIVNYESLCQNRQFELERIMQFLGCEIELGTDITGKASSLLKGTMEMRKVSRKLFDFLCPLI